MQRMASKTETIIKLREGSHVSRCHTLPHHGEYTVGKHSYDAVMLLMELHPNPTLRLVKAVLYHDLGERWCGDVPAPSKWSDGEISKRLALLEKRCLEALGYGDKLTPEEVMWVNAVDKLELLLWSKDQLAFGNMNAASIIGNLISYFKRTTMPKEVEDFMEDHCWTRTPDELPT